MRGAAVAADELLALFCVLVSLRHCFFFSGERTSGHWRDRLFGAAAPGVEVRRRRRRRRPERFFFYCGCPCVHHLLSGNNCRDSQFKGS